MVFICVCNNCGLLLKEEESVQVAENIHFCDKECETEHNNKTGCQCGFCIKGRKG